MSLLGKIGKAIVDPGSLVTDQVDKLASKVGLPTQLSPGHLLHKTLTNGTESALNKIGGGEKQPDGVEEPKAQPFTALEARNGKVDQRKAEQEVRLREEEARELADIEARRHQNKV
jgi:hypothetical protein